MRHSLDRYNYYSDRRVSDSLKRKDFNEGVDEKRKIYTFTYYDSEDKKTLPLCWAVCYSCEGEGKYVNPSIDAGGISQDDEFWHDDVDDETGRSRYFSGFYDIACQCCNGRSTVLVINREAADPETLALYDKMQEDDAKYRREQLAELRAGA